MTKCAVIGDFGAVKAVGVVWRHLREKGISVIVFWIFTVNGLQKKPHFFNQLKCFQLSERCCAGYLHACGVYFRSSVA